MQSALAFIVQKVSPMSGDFWPDFFYTITIIIPNAAAVLLAYLAYLQSRSNGKKLNRVERTLNGKEEESAEDKK